MSRHLLTAVFSFLMVIAGCRSEMDEIQEPPSGSSVVTSILNDTFKDEPVAILAQKSSGIFLAFSRELRDGSVIEFKNSDYTDPFNLEDTEGNIWNYEGLAISGDRKGSQLKPLYFVKGFWFAISSFYPRVTLFNESKQERINSENPTADWLINPEQIQIATFQDAIPALTYPEFIEIRVKDFVEENSFYIKDDDEVIIITKAGITKIYPIKILNWHEIVNDTIGTNSVTITHCPLTATTSVIDNSNSLATSGTFGVSGLLHNNNLIMYDKGTGSLWSQIKNYSISGTLIGEKLPTSPYLETNFKFVKQVILGRRNVKVMTYNTEFKRDYDIYPYGSYRTNNQIYFPLSYHDNRLQPKEIVMALIIDDEAKVYRYSDFE